MPARASHCGDERASEFIPRLVEAGSTKIARAGLAEEFSTVLTIQQALASLRLFARESVADDIAVAGTGRDEEDERFVSLECHNRHRQHFFEIGARPLDVKIARSAAAWFVELHDEFLG